MRTDGPAPAERIEQFHRSFSSATEQCVTQTHRPALNKALDPECWGGMRQNSGSTVCRWEICASRPHPLLCLHLHLSSARPPLVRVHGGMLCSFIHFQEQRQFCLRTLSMTAQREEDSSRGPMVRGGHCQPGGTPPRCPAAHDLLSCWCVGQGERNE